MRGSRTGGPWLVRGGCQAGGGADAAAPRTGGYTLYE